jgi:hypothetical protein
VRIHKGNARVLKAIGAIACCASPFACTAGAAGSGSGAAAGFVLFLVGVGVFVVGRLIE